LPQPKDKEKTDQTPILLGIFGQNPIPVSLCPPGSFIELPKGVPQKVLVESLKVNPSYISRILKNPDRSKLATLRKISSALDVELKSVLA